MSIVQQARAALDLPALQIPDSLPVTAIEVEEEVDFSGEDALRVYVILRDDTDDSLLTGESILELKGAIHETLLAHGIRLFPYTFLRTESERRDEIAAAGDPAGA